MTAALDAALGYIRRGWLLLPVGSNKRPLTKHGLHDASRDHATIRRWWQRFPDAHCAVATGKVSGIVALDIDISDKGSGLDSLEEMGVFLHPITPTAHTPRGGIHCLFAAPAYEVRNSAGMVGAFVDVRGDGGYLVLPPGPGRWWDHHLGPDTPLAAMPEWMGPTEPVQSKEPLPSLRLTRDLSLYGKKALDSAVEAIVNAPNGQQRHTLNREAYGIGQLVGGDAIPAALAFGDLRWAARQMVSHDARRPWRPHDLDRAVMRAFHDGIRNPRGVPQ